MSASVTLLVPIEISDIHVLVQGCSLVEADNVVYRFLRVNFENLRATKVSPILVPLDELELLLVNHALNAALRVAIDEDVFTALKTVDPVGRKFAAALTVLRALEVTRV